PLSISGGTLSVSGAGTGADNGGEITLSGTAFNLNGFTLTLKANGSGIGSGGTVSLTTSYSISNLSLGTGADQVSISDLGGTGGITPSTAGNGGSVSIAVGQNLTADLTQQDPQSGQPIALQAGPLGLNGNGASISLTAGTST